jgi:hypothetical protein
MNSILSGAFHVFTSAILFLVFYLSIALWKWAGRASFPEAGNTGIQACPSGQLYS